VKHEAFKESAKVVERCIIITPAASEEEASIFFLFEERWCEGGKDISLSLSLFPSFRLSLSSSTLNFFFASSSRREKERE